MPIGVLTIIVLFVMAARLLYVELDRRRLMRDIAALKQDKTDLSDAIIASSDMDPRRSLPSDRPGDRR